MRVALLDPKRCASEWRPFYFQDGLVENIVQHMTTGGWEVVHVDLGEETSSTLGASSNQSVAMSDLYEVATFLGNTHEYGLLYNLCGVTPALLSEISPTPMITILDWDLYKMDSRVYSELAKSRNYFWIGTNGQLEKPVPGPMIELPGDQSSDWSVLIADALVKSGKELLKRLQKEDHRPWGYYVVLSDLDDHKVKRIIVYPGKRLSLQSHKRRSEHWMVVSGKGVVTLDSREVELSPGDSVDIPVGTRHRMTNRSDAPVVFVEIQTGDYFGEDDIERYEDDFGRA